MIEIDKSKIDSMKLLGKGASGVVYQYEEDKILKLFHPKWKKEKVEEAYRISKAVSESDVPTAKIYDFVKCDEQYGYIAKRLTGEPLPVYIGADIAKRYDAAKNMGKILKMVHLIELDETVFPPVKDMFSGVIEICSKYFTEEQFDLFVSFVDELPGKKCVLHGDFHENNLMMSDDEYNLIDLDGMSIGSPIFDFMQSYCTYRTPMPKEWRDMIGLTDEVIDEFLYIFLENYFEIKDRKVLKRYDDCFTKISAFMRFFAPLFMQTDTEENLQKYVDDNINGIFNLMEEAKEELKNIVWN